MAAHIEGKGVTVLDMTGLAQKGGSVYSHIRIAAQPDDIHAVRVAAGEARLVIGCDMIVAASDEAIAKMQTGTTHAVINADLAPVGGFTKDPDLHMPERDMADAIQEACGAQAVDFVDATELATSLLGDSIATNLFMVGFAWQKGLIPVTHDALIQAIELNGVAVESNRKAFEWGRLAVVDVDAVRRAATPAQAGADSQRISDTLEETIGRRKNFLAQYQDDKYAARYADFVERVRAAEQSRLPGSTALTEAVARYLFKLMAYKDEYEVARLHTDTGFLERIADQFEGDYRVNLHLAPPLWAKPDPATGEARKSAYGPWMFSAMRFLARLKLLRGTAFDPFGYSAERREERGLIAEYEKTIGGLLADLDRERLSIAVDIASIPEHIRGYGHVKVRHLADAKKREAELLELWRNPEARRARTIPIRAAA